MSLNFALETGSQDLKSVYPSLYLNVAQGYEDLGDIVKATEAYHLALDYASFLPDDGYGKMIRSGIIKGLERVQGIGLD